MKKITALLLVVLFMVSIPGVVEATDRRGVYVELDSKKVGFIAGELVAVRVKQRQLILMREFTQEDFVVNVNDVIEIIIPRKSGALAGAILGSLAGILLYKINNPQLHQRYSRSLPSEGTVMGAAAVIFGLSGMAIGALFGINQTIQIVGKSEAEIENILEKLSKKARVPDYN